MRCVGNDRRDLIADGLIVVLSLRIIPGRRSRKATCKAARDKREGAENPKHRMHAVLLQSAPMAVDPDMRSYTSSTLSNCRKPRSREVEMPEVRCLIHATHPHPRRFPLMSAADESVFKYRHLVQLKDPRPGGNTRRPFFRCGSSNHVVDDLIDLVDASA